MYRRVSNSYWFNNNSSVSPFEARFSPFIVERKSKQDPENRFPLFRSRIFFLSIPSFFLVFTSPFSHHLIFHFCLCVCGSGGCLFVVAWPAWLRWLVPLAPPLPLRPLRSVPRPVRCDWGIKPSALCTFARQAGPRCPTPTTLWTTARPSKTAGPPNPPTPSVSSHVSAPVWPLANPHIQPASHSVTPQLNHGHHFLQRAVSKVCVQRVSVVSVWSLCSSGTSR